jgi:hypothetical protein
MLGKTGRERGFERSWVGGEEHEVNERFALLCRRVVS